MEKMDLLTFELQFVLKVTKCFLTSSGSVTVIKVMYLYLNLCLSATLNSLSCPFTSISY